MSDSADIAARQLCDAIQDGHVRELILSASSSADRLALADVAASIEALDLAVEADRRQIANAFGEHGPTTAKVDEGVAQRPLRLVNAMVDATEVTAAVDTIEQLGYHRHAPSSPGAWRAYQRLHAGCALADAGPEQRRVELTWAPNRQLSGWKRRLIVPSASDFETVDLPSWLWPVYFAVHLALMPVRLWQRRYEAPYLGPYLVTPPSLIEPLLNFAGAQPGELVVDLGCGDGRIVIEAARRGCLSRGVESDAALADRARKAATEAGFSSKIDIVHGDATTAPLDDADVVIMFLPVTSLEALLPDVLERMRPGARLVVHEQERLNVSTMPETSAPISSSEGLTVAHRWTR